MEINYLFSLLMGVILGLLAAHLAMRKGREPMIWFLVGLLTGLVGIALLYFLTPMGFGGGKEEEKAKAEDAEKKELLPAPSVGGQQSGSEEQGPAALEDSEQWFYLDGEHQQQGPFNLGELREAWRQQRLQPTSYVWCPHLSGWMTVESLPTLQGALQR